MKQIIKHDQITLIKGNIIKLANKGRHLIYSSYGFKNPDNYSTLPFQINQKLIIRLKQDWERLWKWERI